MNRFFILILITALVSCKAPAGKEEDQARQVGNNTDLTIFPIAGGWGYSIAVNGHTFIRQEAIPVLQGSHPFATRAQAEKVGSWVATRIRHNKTFSLTLPVLQNLIGTSSIEN